MAKKIEIVEQSTKVARASRVEISHGDGGFAVVHFGDVIPQRKVLFADMTAAQVTSVKKVWHVLGDAALGDYATLVGATVANDDEDPMS